MSFRRWRRTMRCMLKHGPRGCPHIERHTRRPRLKKGPDPLPSAAPPPQIDIKSAGRHVVQ